LPLSGREAWLVDCPKWTRNWYNLVILASKRVSLGDVQSFCKSYIDLKKNLTRSDFNYEKGAVFNEHERLRMKEHVAKLRTAYDQVVEELKNVDEKVILSWTEKFEKVAKPLIEYDDSIGAIAAERAIIVYSSKAKKDLGKGAFTLSQRIQSVGMSEQIAVTNPSGLLGDVRTPFRASKTKDLSDLLSEYKTWVNLRYPDPETIHSELVSEWIKNTLGLLKNASREDEDD